MISRLRALVFFAFGVVSTCAVHAQAIAGPQAADFIVAVVNSEPITNSEVRTQVERMSRQMAQQRQAVPDAQQLRRLVLERLINERAQVQFARDTGIRADAAAIDQAEQTVAAQNQVDVAELRRRAAKDGLTVTAFRNQLRDQLLLTRLHERDVQSKITVTDGDVDRYLQEQQAADTDPFVRDINLAQILIAVPEKASGEDAAQIFLQAQKVLDRLRAGEDFEALVKQVSAADRSKGGQLGLRRADRYPVSFVQATQNLKVGEISDIVRSAVGFHILKVVEKRAPAVLVKTVEQNRARHILLRTDPKFTVEDAVKRLSVVRAQIVAGKATFPSVARDISQDSSAADGGDLGWAFPGMFVPEFEEALARLEEGEVSFPVVSRFGVHLIQLVERRRVELTPAQLRESVRNLLREIRYEEAYVIWARDVRARAFVEMRDAPE